VISCDDDSQCPSGLTCVGHVCQGEGATCRAGTPDASGGGDAPDARDAADVAGASDATDMTIASDAPDARDAAPDKPPCPRRFTGMTTEYDIPTPNASATNIAVAANGIVWFNEMNAAVMGRVDGAGCVTEVPLPAPAYDLTAGPNQRIWFSELGQNKVGWIDPDGTVRDVAVTVRPSNISGNAQLVAFASTNQLVILDANGTMMGSPMDVCVSATTVHAIGVNAIGGVWSAEAQAMPAFNYLTYAGSGSLCANPAILKEVHGLAPGSGRTLWITDPVANVIAYSNVDNLMTPFVSKVLAGANPTRVALAPNGKAYFTEPGTNKVGFAVLSSDLSSTNPDPISINEYTLSANAGPAGIAAAADGTIWFVEQNANKVASIP
jgi:virginiamycin B lyase